MTQISPNVCRLSKYDEVMKQEEVAELRKSKNDNEDLGETIKYLQVLFCLTPVFGLSMGTMLILHVWL